MSNVSPDEVLKALAELVAVHRMRQDMKRGWQAMRISAKKYEAMVEEIKHRKPLAWMRAEKIIDEAERTEPNV